MSSNDRQQRPRRQRPDYTEPQIDDEYQDEDDWDSGADFDDPFAPAPPKPVRPARAARRQASQPALDGTAAQIDRLRRNLARGQRPEAPQPRSTSASRPPVSTRPTQQTRRQAVPDDDMIVAGDPYQRDTHAYRAPATTSRGARRAQAPARPAHEPLYDDAYGDVEYQDAYADYDDDFSEYDAPRRPARAQRPQIRVPAMSRPSLPPVIANADLVNDAPALGFIGVGLASLAAMAVLVANQADTLAPEFATHVTASGILERFRDESAIWNLPLLAAMCTLMNIVIAWFASPLDRFASRFALGAALVVQFVAWVALIRLL